VALSSAVLSGEIRALMLSGPTGATDNPALTALCDAIAQAVVAHIQSAAVVAVPSAGLIAPVGGGPVTGAAIGTIT
jgi:hypothetical protein